MKKFLDYITKDSKGQTQWAIFFGLSGTIVAALTAALSWDNSRLFYMNIGPLISVPIGFLCVYYLGIQKNSGNILGILANINEIIVNTLFGNFGYVVSAIYFGLSHVFGFIDWRKNTNEKGDVVVRDIKKQSDVRTLILFLIFGTIFLWLNGVYGWIGEIIFTSPIFWANIIIMYLSIIAQGTMILRYRYSWWIWFATNIISVPLNFATGNTVFAIMYIFYQINCVLALYAQYTTESVEQCKSV